MNPSEELHRVREYLSGANPPPSNEANTCGWVIRPLLHSCGYHYHEIDEQAHDGAGKIPDFTLLPGTPHTWFLEAKKWTETLSDSHTIQAINYAHAQGKRWVVLTNGREWRLYDDHIVGASASERLVAAAKLDCGGQVEALLNALSKASVQSGALEKYVNHTRLNALLTEQLQAPNSDIIAAMHKVLRTKFGLSGVTPAEIVAYFHAAPTVPALPASPVTAAPVLVPPPATVSAPPQTLSADSMTLRELKQAGKSMQGHKPVAITFADGTTKAVNKWTKITCSIVEWLFNRGKKPSMPFSGPQGSKRIFINTTPYFGSSRDDQFVVAIAQGQTFYLHTNRSSLELVECLCILCSEVGESPDGFKVKLK